MKKTNRDLTSVLSAIALAIAACSGGSFDSELRRGDAKLGIGDVDGAIAVYDSMIDRFKDDAKRPTVMF